MSFGNREEQVRSALEDAIKTMRNAVVDLERTLVSNKIEDAVQYMPKQLAWAMANMSSLFESAQMWLNTGNAEKILMMQEEIKKLKGEV